MTCTHTYICKNIIIYICIWYSYMYIFHILAYRTEIKRVHFNLFHWQLVQFWWILQEETHEPPTIWRLRIAHMYDLNAASGLAYQPPFFLSKHGWTDGLWWFSTNWKTCGSTGTFLTCLRRSNFKTNWVMSTSAGDIYIEHQINSYNHISR